MMDELTQTETMVTTKGLSRPSAALPVHELNDFRTTTIQRQRPIGDHHVDTLGAGSLMFRLTHVTREGTNCPSFEIRIISFTRNQSVNLNS